MHQLDIDIPNTLRVTSFKITDCSAYDPALPVTEGWLEVFAPSATQPLLKKVEPYFTTIVNANLLYLNPGRINPLPALPDGAYTIKYSVKPANKVFIQYLHFRNVKQLNSYFELYSSIQLLQGSITNKEYNTHVRNLIWIRQMIDAAKYMAEENHLLKEANQMYNEADRQIEKLQRYVR